MQYFTFTPEGMDSCRVTACLQTAIPMEGVTPEPLPAVVICPGGGYEMVSQREAEPVAKKYVAAGYHAFVLDYTVGDGAKDFLPLLELAATVAHIRRHAQEWMVDGGKIAVCGFSAGGHLAASLGTLWEDETFLAAWRKTGLTEEIRPDAMVLGYPVITADEFVNEGSLAHVSGAAAGSERYLYFGLDRHVSRRTPPAFLWHTSVDTCVPVENSLRFAAALSAAEVPFELHVFPYGNHGLSVCSREVNSPDSYNSRWMEWSIRWLNQLFSYEE